VEVYGPESSGKTTLTLTAIAQAQKAGGLAAFIDVEHALDPNYARRLGVNMDELLVSQPSSGEEALRICETLVRSNALDVIVSTPWPPWSPARSSKARSATPPSVPRRA
jgi:recombination protein RecA